MSLAFTDLGNLITLASAPRAGKRDYPILSMTMHGGLVDQSEKFKKRVASEDTSAYKVVRANQLVVGFPIDEGVLSFQTMYDEAIVSPAYDVWSIKDATLVDNSYLEKFLRSPQSLSFYRGKLRSTTARRRTIPKETFLGLQVPLPPLDEQKRIAAILDQADELRRKRRRAIDRLNQLGKAIFNDMFGDPATNPKGFRALPLGEAVDFIGGAQPAKSNFLYEDGPDRIRFVQIRDFRTDKYRTYVPKALAKRPFAAHDVMIGRYGPPVFQIFRGLSGTYNVALMKATPRMHLTSDFIYYLLQEPKLHSFVVANSERTAGQSGVNLDLLEQYPAYAPPVKLLEEFSARIIDLKEQEEASFAASKFTESLFLSLQHRAFRGEL
jgi:type I restriction enzyme S subunit